MRKIPTLYVRDPADRAHVLPQVTEGCEWVLTGEGVATRKYDGTCCMLDNNGGWWARREVKPGKPLPNVFWMEQTDPVTGKVVGWVPMEGSAFERWHREALAEPDGAHIARPAGTYELCGPKINGNPEGFQDHRLLRHGATLLGGLSPATFENLRGFLLNHPFEGIVWHHPDGRMCKLKRRDFT